MATYNWTTLTNGQVIAFNPTVDVLAVNDVTISADIFSFSFPSASSSPCTFTFGAKSVTLQTAFASMTTASLTFADGSIFVVGDNTTGTANDDSANTLTGGSGNDHLVGLGGNDNMTGGAGNDCFSMAYTSNLFGNDTIDGGSGFDTLDYGNNSVNPATVNLATHSATNAQGNTTFISIETVNGTAGNDVFTGGDAAHATNSLGNTTTERFRGEAGNDSITGGSGTGFFTVADYSNNSSSQAVSANLAARTATDGRGGTDTLVNVDALRGGAGNDSLFGGSLSRSVSGTFFESFRGNAGNDTFNGNNAGTSGLDGSSDRADYANNLSSQAVNVNLATGVALDGLGGSDTLIDIDHVYGGAGNDTLTGGSANDDFDGGAGNDTINGGAGSDTVRFQQSTGRVIVNLSSSAIVVEGVTVAARTANDGMGGTDTLTSIESVRGSDLDDYIRGSDDVATRQFLSGEAGNDTIDGGAGIDIANYAANAIVLGGINAFIENGSGIVSDKTGGTDTLINVEGLAGTHTSDTLNGGAGDQWFRGNGGNDTINGGAGSDWVFYSNDPSGVTINLAAGIASDGWNGAGGELALGGSDTLTSIENAEGSNYADSITGDSGANILTGRTGNDTLAGGLGMDTATFTGLRRDYTITRSGAATTVSGPDGTDTLTGIERLQFSDLLISNGHTRPAVDFDGNGKTDILWKNTDGTISVWTMDGTTNTAGAVFGPYTGWSVFDGRSDLNGDGKTDLVWNNTDGSVSLWTMDGTTNTSSALFGPYSGWSLFDSRADFNGDGKNDLVWKHTDGSVSLWQMNGTVNTTSARFGPYSGWSLFDSRSDFNADGKTDLVWKHTDGSVSVWTMDGTTNTGTAVFGPYAGWSLFDTHSDFNGDGKNDWLWKNTDGTISLWTMDGTTNTAGAVFGPYAGWTLFGNHSDFNGDGKSDLVWTKTDGTVSVWTMDGVSNTGQAQFGPYAGWTLFDSERDFNGDGKSDLLWKNGEGAISVWTMDGTTNTASAVFGPYGGWTVLKSSDVLGGQSDFNGDGKHDIAWQKDDGTISVWLMDGVANIGQAQFGPYAGWTPELV
jgi:Ca2+-binding RTX toxin-like protein